nr:response regulator [Chloroflexota bacterium]
MPDKILIIDDDPLAVKLMRLSFVAEGFEVTSALDAREGLLAVQTDQPDLILLDIMMPGVDGLEMCRQLRSRPQTAHIPIIFLTAKTQLDDKITGLQAGADDYITKPADPREVVARVKAVLARTRRVAATKQGWVISLIGAKGGVGTTTIAVNLGVALARRKVPTILMDLHAHSGTVAWQLKLPARISLTELLKMEANQIDSHQLARRLFMHSSGLAVLPSVPTDTNLLEISQAHVSAIIRSARSLADAILLDLPHMLSPGTKEALSQSDMALLVLGPQPIDVACAEQLNPWFEDAGLTGETVSLIVVNRASSTGTLSLPQIEQQLKKASLGFIPPAMEELSFSYQQGVPLVLAESGGAAVLSLQKLAERLHSALSSHMLKPR